MCRGGNDRARAEVVLLVPGPRIYTRVSTKAKPTPVQSRQRPKIHPFRRFPFFKIKEHSRCTQTQSFVYTQRRNLQACAGIEPAKHPVPLKKVRQARFPRPT